MGVVEIELVRTEAQAAAVRVLAWEFIDWLRERYPEMLDGIEEYLANQDFQGMLDTLLESFAPPTGECLLARLDGQPVGILMLKPYGGDACEMNRMFVRDTARGHGVARALSARLIERARDLGYKEMVLSALDRHHEAIALYTSLGFEADSRAPDTTSAANREVQMRMAL
jgi:GNAT superfamily N-acetyltransferase